MIFTDFRALIPPEPYDAWLPDIGSSRVTITYAFRNTPPSYHYDEFGALFTNSFAPVSGFGQTLARSALQAWEENSGIDFVEVFDGRADIVIGSYNLLLDPRVSDAAAFAYFPDSVLQDYSLAGDIFFDHQYTDQLDIWLHEIGHALGLDHPFEGNILSPALDNGSNTVMSYNRTGNEDSLGRFDIDAIQFLYGPPAAEPHAANDTMFRFINTFNGVHFYTANATERDNIINTLPHYTYEGPAFAVPETDGDIGVYRFYNLRNGVHFYTASEKERDIVIETLSNDYQYEGLVFKAWENQDAPGEQAALHRFYRPNVGSHFYTANEDEFLHVRDTMQDFVYEGVAYYVDIL